MSSIDVLLPEAMAASVGRTKLAAFLPMALAVVGVFLVLLGGVNARTPSAEVAASPGVDPIVTGSIMTPDDRRQALEMLDR
jgi:hypothetical protein